MAWVLRHWPVFGAIVAFLLQVIVAPIIQIGYAMPNFVLAFVVVNALVRPTTCGMAMPFVVGLAYDLVGAGPVGGMALICVLVTFAASRLMILLQHDSLVVPIALLVIMTFVAQIIYALLMIACGMDVGFLESLLYRCLPCGLYDTVVALIMFPIMTRFASHDDTLLYDASAS